MRYFSEPGSHIRDKVKVVFDLSNYPNKKELERATDIDTSDITTKKDVIPLKVEVEQTLININIILQTRH